ncbi:MAG: DUF4340 domain-containing protein [Gemmatimonadota bacterium]|jgi:hypothetical protein|nr:DUF4340 domain-containing protein [Gemmatimonadota bacterium]MDP6529812.1 DUF4340 domain-containing protein [Gemmatimonadota bacterium]MDP6803034.1 DUF4340 domain-containing protein [Gemmatimonadota bacterium]MDP7032121.1 DUF4340 domain-containing protein [Gemmatimonadota bacterium]
MTGRNRTLWVLVGLFLVLVVLSQLTGKRRNATTEGGGIVPLITGLDTAEIGSIRAWLGSSPDSVLEVRRSGDGWEVSSRWNWPAKQTQVDQFMNSLNDLRGEIRSSTEDILADYDLDEESGLHVVAMGLGGTERFHVIAGKTASRGGSFTRLADSPAVYLVRASLRSTFGIWGDSPEAPDAKRWVDLSIHKADRNEVDQVVLQGDDRIVLTKVLPAPAGPDSVVDRSSWTWKADAHGGFDKAAADGIVGSLCSLYAQNVADPAGIDRYGLGEGSRIATLTMADGTTREIRFGAETEDGQSCYMRVGPDGNPATLHKGTADRLFPDRESLTPKE